MRWLAAPLFFVCGICSAETISGTVITVIDGDTITVSQAGKHYRVRLAGIDAPEPAQPFGLRSARSLAKLCYRKAAEVEWKDRSDGMYLGQVTCEGRDVNAEQVRRGLAWVSPKHITPGSPLYELEAYARLRKIGLWADEKAVAPWEWRGEKAQ
jgi:endonuclease YncB( thermonuclease family)